MSSGRTIPRRAVLTALGLLLAAGYIALGLSRITLDVDVTRLLPPGLKETTGYRLFLKNFAGRDELIVTLEGSAASDVEAVAAALEQSLQAGGRPLARRVVWRSPFELETSTAPLAVDRALGSAPTETAPSPK